MCLCVFSPFFRTFRAGCFKTIPNVFGIFSTLWRLSEFLIESREMAATSFQHFKFYSRVVHRVYGSFLRGQVGLPQPQRTPHWWHAIVRPCTPPVIESENISSPITICQALPIPRLWKRTLWAWNCLFTRCILLCARSFSFSELGKVLLPFSFLNVFTGFLGQNCFNFPNSFSGCS